MAPYGAQERERNRQSGYGRQKKYIRAKCRVISMTLNLEYDAEIIAHLDKQPNRTAYLKKLIENDMKR